MLLQMPQHEFIYTFAMNARMKIVKRDRALSIWWRLSMTSFPMREWIKPDHSSVPLCNNNDIRGRENENMDGNRHRWKVRGRVIEGVYEWLSGACEWSGTQWYGRREQRQVKRQMVISQKNPFLLIHSSIMQPFDWQSWCHRKKREN